MHHDYAEENREAWRLLGERLDNILMDENVLPLRRAAKGLVDLLPRAQFDERLHVNADGWIGPCGHAERQRDQLLRLPVARTPTPGLVA